MILYITDKQKRLLSYLVQHAQWEAKADDETKAELTNIGYALLGHNPEIRYDYLIKNKVLGRFLEMVINQKEEKGWEFVSHSIDSDGYFSIVMRKERAQ